MTLTTTTTNTLTSAELYAEAKRAGVEIDSHESDLYLPVNDITRELIARYEFKANVTTFTSQIPPHAQWYDIPFAYQPFWERRGLSATVGPDRTGT